jgi:hypothetical protein
MADQVKNLCQADLAKLPFFSRDMTDTFTCKQWITWVQCSKDSSGWGKEKTMTYAIDTLQGSPFTYTPRINPSSKVNIESWESFKVWLLNVFSVIRTFCTTTINLTSLVQGVKERVTNFYIWVFNAINDIESLKKIKQQRVLTYPWGEATNVLQFTALDVAILTAILLNHVNFGIQDCLDYMSLNLFVSGLKPNVRKEVTLNMSTPPWTPLDWLKRLYPCSTLSQELTMARGRLYPISV